MSRSSCELCDATALSLCDAKAVTGASTLALVLWAQRSVESRAQRVQAGARRKHEHGSEFLLLLS